MSIPDRIAGMQAEVAAWRRDIHAHPEILFDVLRTAGSVAEKLKAFGCDEVVTGIGKTGVGGGIRGQGTEGSKGAGRGGGAEWAEGKKGGEGGGGRAPMWPGGRGKKRPPCRTARPTRARCTLA